MPGGLLPPDPDPFRCEVSRARDRAQVMPIGELDVATVPVLQGEIDALRDTGVRHVTLDLSGVVFMDSTGLRFILDTDAEARQDGFSIALIQGPPAVRRVFELTNTQAHLTFIDP